MVHDSAANEMATRNENSQPQSSEAATEHHFFVVECDSVRLSMNANDSSQLEEQSQDQ